LTILLVIFLQQSIPYQPIQHISSLLDQLCYPSYTFTLSYFKPCTMMSSGSMYSANLQIQSGRHVKLEEETTKILSDTITLGDRVISECVDEPIGKLTFIHLLLSSHNSLLCFLHKLFSQKYHCLPLKTLYKY
jgi:hypothetical protein